MAKIIILKNNTAVDIEFNTLGETLFANDQIDVSEYTSSQLRNDTNLTTGVDNGDITVNDGAIDLDVEIGGEYIRNDTVKDEDGFWYGKRRRFSILWNQTNHGFVQGQIIRLDESTGLATLALADSHANSATTAAVSEIVDANSFYAGLTGAVVNNIDASAVEGGIPLTPGTAYFLSTTVPGQITPNVPTGAGEIVKLVGLAIDTNAIMLFSYSGYENETAIETTQVAALQAGNLVRGRPTWQNAVNDIGTNDPSSLSPVEGDRHIVGSSPIGAWSGKANQIAEFVGSTSTWYFTTPNDGYIVYDRGTNRIYGFDGSSWILLTRDIVRTFASDSGSFVASSPTDTLNIVGGTNVSTSVAGNTLTIDSTLNATGDLAAATYGFATTFNLPTSWTDVNWDTIHLEGDTSVIQRDSVNQDRINIKEDGIYLINFSMSFDADSGEEQISAKIVANGTTDVPGSYRLASEDDEINDLSNAFAAQLSAGDYITMQVMASGNGNTMHNSSNLSIVRLRGTKGDPGPVGSGSNIIVQDEGTSVTNTPHSSLNFTGAGVTVTDGGSGVATINIPGGSANTPKICHRHNAGVVQSLSSSFNTVNMSGNIRTDTIYSVSFNQVTINESGWYRVSYSVGADATSSTRSVAEHQLELDGALIPGSMSWSYHRTSSAGRDTASGTIVVQVTAGQRIRLRSRERNGGIKTVANGCRLLIEQIETV